MYPIWYIFGKVEQLFHKYIEYYIYKMSKYIDMYKKS